MMVIKSTRPVRPYTKICSRFANTFLGVDAVDGLLGNIRPSNKDDNPTANKYPPIPINEIG